MHREIVDHLAPLMEGYAVEGDELVRVLEDGRVLRASAYEEDTVTVELWDGNQCLKDWDLRFDLGSRSDQENAEVLDWVISAFVQGLLTR